jgi:hypothetical protein
MVLDDEVDEFEGEDAEALLSGSTGDVSFSLILAVGLRRPAAWALRTCRRPLWT